MASVDLSKATLEDLSREPGKAELIAGRIVHLMPTGRRPNRVAGRIFRSLDDHAEKTGVGEAYTDNMGFAVQSLTSGRESFSPDAAYYDGPLPTEAMRFIEGPPTLGVEVRSESDYGPTAEIMLADKRADYFQAGTQVVWDVDPVHELVHVYHAQDPENPRTFGLGQTADAEPAVPGWRVEVAWIFAD